MVAECTFTYESGRKCRRLPRRGETLCRDHRRHAAASRQPIEANAADEEAADREWKEVFATLDSLPLDQLLKDLGDTLLRLGPLVTAHASRHEIALFNRATCAFSLTLECAQAAPSALAAALPGIPREHVQLLVAILHNARLPLSPEETVPPAATMNCPNEVFDHCAPAST
jgi:hypothetical protein